MYGLHAPASSDDRIDCGYMHYTSGVFAEDSRKKHFFLNLISEMSTEIYKSNQ